MATSITDIDAPEDAPGPSDDVIAEKYKGRMVIYSMDDGGWTSHVEIPIDSQWAIINVHDVR